MRTGLVFTGEDPVVLFGFSGTAGAAEFPAFDVCPFLSEADLESADLVGAADTPYVGLVGIGQAAVVRQQKERAVVVIQADGETVIVGVVFRPFVSTGVLVDVLGILAQVITERGL